MIRIFISYRRDDTSGHAGRLYDSLAGHFDPEQIFMDVDDIPFGHDFTQVINDAVGSCDVLLCLIGARWISTADAQGMRRLEDPHDFVRLEIEAALRRNVRLIPVLVQKTEMPRPEELPAALAPLSRRNALEISDGRWRYDVGRLIEALDRVAVEIEGEKERTRAAEKERAHAAEVERERAAHAPAWKTGPTIVGEGTEPSARPADTTPTGKGSSARLRHIPRRMAIVALSAVGLILLGLAFVSLKPESDDVDFILGHVPDDIRDTCEASGALPINDAVIEEVVCDGPAGDLVYSLWSNLNELPFEVQGGPCEDLLADSDATHEYRNGEAVGMLRCGWSETELGFLWTDARFEMTGQYIVDVSDADADAAEAAYTAAYQVWERSLMVE